MGRILENVKVTYVCEPKDAPTGLLSFILFGKTTAELAEEIATNRNGKWNEVYEE